MGLVFGSIQLLRFVDMESPRTVMMLRIGYIASQMLMLLFWTYMRSSVLGKKDLRTVEVEEPAVPFSGEAAKKKRMTITEYDTMECRKQMQQVVIGTAIMVILHLWLGLLQPLFLQMILPWKSLITQPLVQIHLMGYAAEGSLKRPFKQPNPFGDLMSDQTSEPPASSPESVEQPAIKNADADSKSSKKKKSGRKED